MISNIGLVNAAGLSTTVLVELFGGSGEKLKWSRWPLGGNQALFLSRVVNALGVSSLSNGYLRVKPASASVYGWASVVDKTSTGQILIRSVGRE